MSAILSGTAGTLLVVSYAGAGAGVISVSSLPNRSNGFILTGFEFQAGVIHTIYDTLSPYKYLLVFGPTVGTLVLSGVGFQHVNNSGSCAETNHVDNIFSWMDGYLASAMGIPQISVDLGSSVKYMGYALSCHVRTGDIPYSVMFTITLKGYTNVS